MDDDQLRWMITSFAVGLMVAIKPYVGGWMKRGARRLGIYTGRAIGSFKRAYKLR